MQLKFSEGFDTLMVGPHELGPCQNEVPLPWVKLRSIWMILDLCGRIVVGFYRKMVLEFCGYETWHSASPLPLSSHIRHGTMPPTTDTIATPTREGAPPVVNTMAPAVDTMDTSIEKDAPAIDTMAPAVDTHVDSGIGILDGHDNIVAADGGGMSTAVDESTATYVDILADSLTAVTKAGTADDTVACSGASTAVPLSRVGKKKRKLFLSLHSPLTRAMFKFVPFAVGLILIPFPLSPAAVAFVEEMHIAVWGSI
ncbi:hypothetical protein COLO4_10004 [Corchorus olitorius]|uniref:Uncharacterized protein n=1 Tax=Corchorus olitorius TaxID=93759 RepID=A0A1R3KAE2_9ROSI|nr:hypothetical protein COLO4_10004 [Corchorus olitorius]